MAMTFWGLDDLVNLLLVLDGVRLLPLLKLLLRLFELLCCFLRYSTLGLLCFCLCLSQFKRGIEYNC